MRCRLVPPGAQEEENLRAQRSTGVPHFHVGDRTGLG